MLCTFPTPNEDHHQRWICVAAFDLVDYSIRKHLRSVFGYAYGEFTRRLSLILSTLARRER